VREIDSAFVHRERLRTPICLPACLLDSPALELNPLSTLRFTKRERFPRDQKEEELEGWIPAHAAVEEGRGWGRPGLPGLVSGSSAIQTGSVCILLSKERRDRNINNNRHTDILIDKYLLSDHVGTIKLSLLLL